MMEVRKLGFLQAIPLLITICLISLPAYAKYSGGSGEPNDPYQIATAEDLILLGKSTKDYDKHFILTADIDLDPNLPGRKVFDKAVIAADMNDTKSWIQGTSFTGVFDGNGYVISNLHINGSSFLGLFGHLNDGADISNLGIEAVDVNGTGNYVGGLVGSNGGAVIACYSTGTVSGASDVGGLLGSNRGAVTDCYTTGTVSGTSDVGDLLGSNRGNVTDYYIAITISGSGNVGGLIGDNGGDVTDCYSSSEVSGGYHIGGLVGYSYRGYVTECYSTGSVSGGDIVGGLVGGNFWEGMFYLQPEYHLITNCYSTGSVSGNELVGGLVGGNRGTITNCYSTGSVSGNESVGGLVGDNNIEESVTACFWDIQTSGQTTSDSGTGLTTTEMQTESTFIEVGWDFIDETANGTDDIWRIDEGKDYSRLWWEQEVNVVEQVSLPLYGESGEMILGLGSLDAAAYSPDGKYIATAGSLGAFLWDAETGALVRTFLGHTGGVLTVAFSPDGMRVLTGSFDDTAKLWDAETGQEIRTFGGHTGSVYSVAFSPDGTRILTGSADWTANWTAKLWDVETGQEIRTFGGHTGVVYSLAFSPDGMRVLTGSYDETAKLWDAETGQEIRTFGGHTGYVYSVAFSPDGTRVLTGSFDETAKLWDAETGQEIRTFGGHTREVNSVAFSPDGTRVLTGGGRSDDIAKLWDAETGQEIRTFGG
ncbi:MAG: GLUG motif-containing protein, partial [Planctomycetota bacterium]